MRRRRPSCPMLAIALCVGLITLGAGADGSGPVIDGGEAPPNIVVILADDLGYAELGCYGQTRIRTPNLDRMAAEGMRFTQCYSGSPVCAPSRGTLLTGLHTGHAYVRNNFEMGGWERDAPEGQLPLPPDTVTIGALLRGHGYATAAMGKWGLGGPGSTGHPNRQGFDRWYGYLCQRVAHNYYPTHLWRNDEQDVLDNPYFEAHQRLDEPPATPDAYARFAASDFAPDLMIEEALGFIREHRGTPFLLYYATPVPHAAIQVPDEALTPYRGVWPETPYLGQKGYLPHPTPRAGYAAMVSRMDRDVGSILTLVDELGLDERTLVLFTSDNGPTYNGGTDSAFFESTGPLRGLKGSVYEGGIRVPMIVRWPGRIEAGAVSDHVCAFWDLLPTVCALVGAETPADLDGLSFAPTLLGRPDTQMRHGYLYWEHGGKQAARVGSWKGVRRRGRVEIELYDLDADLGEQEDVAAEHPDVTALIRDLFRLARTESEHFPLGR